MSDSAAPSALLDGRVAAGHKAMVTAGLFGLASLGTAVAIFGLGALVSDQKDREAGRMIVDAQKGPGYVATVVGGYAARQGRPYGF